MKQNLTHRTPLCFLLFFVILFLAPAALPVSDAAAEDRPVPLESGYFPDPIFLGVACGFDTDGSNSLSPAECAAVTEIRCSGREIRSVSGIGYFPNLEVLDVSNNSLEMLDLTRNPQLTEVRFGGNYPLTTVYTDGLTALRTLDCFGCQTLRSLSLADCSALVSLNCGMCPITSLNLSACGGLENLECALCSLTELDLSAQQRLRNLQCGGNPLTALTCDIDTLESLDCGGCQLEMLDVRGCSRLASLSCSANMLLRGLDVSGMTSLREVTCTFCGLQALDVTGCTGLLHLDALGNPTLLRVDLRTVPTLYPLIQTEGREETGVRIWEEGDLYFSVDKTAALIREEPDWILPPGLTAVEEEAFAGLKGVVIRLPGTVEHVGLRAFEPWIVIRCPAGSATEEACKAVGVFVIGE